MGAQTMQPKIEYKYTPIVVESLDEEGVFEGYASVFNEVDQGGDITVRGCFAASLQNRPAERVRMLFQHDPSQVIGKWLSLVEDDRGLRVKGKLSMGLDQARQVYVMMKDELIGGLSIGYRTKRFDYDVNNETRKLLEVDLMEISAVTFPMLESATISAVKSGVMPTEREFEGFLRDAGFSRSQSKAIVAEGYKSMLNGQRDAAEIDLTGLQSAIHDVANTLRRS